VSGQLWQILWYKQAYWAQFRERCGRRRGAGRQPAAMMALAMKEYMIWLDIGLAMAETHKKASNSSFPLFIDAEPTTAIGRLEGRAANDVISHFCGRKSY
jgi:hypothetical protein